MKILHCSDIHLGKRPFGTKEFSQKRYLDFFYAFETLIDEAIRKKVDLVIVAGDLFDKKELTPDVLQKCEKIFIKLKNNNIPAFIIEGNHDNNNNNDLINSWTHYLEDKKLIIRGDYRFEDNNFKFDKFQINDVNIYGIGYPGFAVDEVLTQLSQQLNPLEKNIVVVHTALGGGEYLPGLANSSSIKEFKDKVLYIAGGHLHSFQVYPKENPYFFIPGSLEYWNVLNEKSDKKGGILFDTDTKEYEFVQISPRKRIKTIFNPTSSEIEEEFSKFCENLHLTGEELVIVTINITDNKYINTTEFEKIIEKKGALKGYIQLNYAENNDLNNNNTYTSIKAIEKNIISSWEQFKNKDSICNYLQKFKEYSGDKERQDDFFTLFNNMLEEEISNENK